MKTETRQCQNCKENFTIENEDFNFYKKIKVPPPTFCPLCRVQRRLVFKNERKLFKAKDAFTGKEIFSTYPEQSDRKIVTQEEWHGDSWDAMEYAREVNFKKPFLKQILELDKEIPIYNLNCKLMVNSPYSGNATALKNCYLVFNSNYSEDCMYGNGIDFCKDCVDDSHIQRSERCYESFWLQNCYQCYFTIMSAESRNLWFCRDCLGCNDCFGCANLHKSSYCIFNKKYTKEEYEKEIKRMRLDSIQGIREAREKTRKFWNSQPYKCIQGLKNLNSTGSYVTNCKNVNDSYLVREGENVRYGQYLQVPSSKDNYDITVWGEHIELCYETMECGEHAYNNKFVWDCWPTCKNCEYCTHLFSSSDCFGCAGLKKKQYCILNKQYTKDKYFEMVEKIKKHMDEIPYIDFQGLVYKYGEFFPIEFSPLGYNNTVAMQHFPLTKEETFKKGYTWIEVPHGEYKITIKTGESPNLINNIDDGILKEVIECENCKNPYRILKNELTFLKKEKLPIPHMCNECRHERRINDRLKLFLFERSCMCSGARDSTGNYKNTVKHFHENEPCKEEFKTGYAPNRPEIVYCEKCYQQEVY